jgi:MFS family permease
MGNIPKIFAIKFFAMFIILMPVIVPFFNSLAIGMRGVYLLQAVFSIVTFIFEIPSGYLSDMLGRKKTLILAYLLRSIGFSLFPLADSLTILIIAEVLLGLGLSLSSGTDIAILYDSLSDGPEEQSQGSNYLGKMVFYLTSGEAIASLLATVLLLYHFDLKTLAYLSAITCWIPFFIALSLKEPPRQKMGKNHRENFHYIKERLFNNQDITGLVIFNAIASFSSTLIAVWMFQKYWEQIEIPLLYFGPLWALFNIIVGFFSRKATKMETYLGSSKILIIVGILPILAFTGMGLLDTLWGLLACVLFQVTRGLGQVIFKNALNTRVSSDFRATANSVTQMGVRLSFCILGPIFGHLFDHHGKMIASTTYAFLYTGLFIFLMLPLLRKKQFFT